MDLQWSIVSILFILASLSIIFYILAIIAVIGAYFKSEIYMNWYRDITHYQFK